MSARGVPHSYLCVLRTACSANQGVKIALEAPSGFGLGPGLVGGAEKWETTKKAKALPAVAIKLMPSQCMVE